MIRDYGIASINQDKLARIGIGTGAHYSSFTWGEQQRKESIAVIQAAIDLGISFIDTGETYGKGECERIVGEAIKSNRDKVFIATKISEATLETNNKEEIERACDNSLLRMNIDYIDLYQVHWLNERIDTNCALDCLLELKRKGKIKNIGLCNCGNQQIEKFYDEFESLQIPYSLVWRGMEYEFGNRLEKIKKTPLLYYCLGQGLLGEKYKNLGQYPKSRKRTRLFDSSILNAKHGEKGQEKILANFLKEFHELCQSYHVCESYVAIGWLLKRVETSLAIIGMRNAKQVYFFYELERISDEIYLELTRVSSDLKRCNGYKLDLWDSKERIR